MRPNKETRDDKLLSGPVNVIGVKRYLGQCTISVFFKGAAPTMATLLHF